MSTLTEVEEAQLRRYFAQRWGAHTNDPVIPAYVDQSLRGILKKRSMATDTTLTEYGQTIIPNRNLADQENM